MAARDPIWEMFMANKPGLKINLAPPQMRVMKPADEQLPSRRRAPAIQGTSYVVQHASDKNFFDGQNVESDLEVPGFAAKARVYSSYSFSKKPPPTLGICSVRDELLGLLEQHNVVIVRGYTGCGKTTQIPQYILDQHVEQNKGCNIVVTQPRRIAAMSVARRVCSERNWDVGTIVGYQVGMDPKVSEDTCLSYVTTGCLLERLITEKSLNSFSHIIIDEVHERDEDTDLLMIIVRRLLFRTQSSTKVILMSATIDSGRLAQYFTQSSCGPEPPVVSVSSARLFEVTVSYLEHLRTVGPLPNIDPDKPDIGQDMYEFAAMLILWFDKYEIQLYGAQANCKSLSQKRGAVLVFLPGVLEIETMDKALQKLEQARGGSAHSCKLKILPLHSRVTSEEQRCIFDTIPDGWRKIILATNIAESSITVPDVQYVVDFCLMKQLVADQGTSFCTLKMEWAPQSNLIQREGRVGRVSNGSVYRLITARMFQDLPTEVTPEILRCPLEHSVLRAKNLDMGPPEAILANALDPPDLSNIARTVATLKEVGALHLTANGAPNPCDGDLTYLGRIISRLPIDVHLGKLVVLGHIFNVLEECIIIAAGLGSKSIFTAPYRERLAAYRAKLLWADGSFCDCVTLLNAYHLWLNYRMSGHFNRSGKSRDARERDWARRNFIQLQAINEMHDLVQEIKSRLEKEGIAPLVGPNVKPLEDSTKALILKVVIFGAFYPQFFCRKPSSHTPEEQEAVERGVIKATGGLDPCNTVVFGNFPMQENGKLYVNQIKDFFEEFRSKATVKIDHSKVFVQFSSRSVAPSGGENNLTPGRIHTGVYFALKKRILRENLTIRLLRHQYSDQAVRELEERMENLMSASDRLPPASQRGNQNRLFRQYVLPPAELPSINVQEMDVEVCHAEDAGHFWVQRADDSSRAQLIQVVKLSNDLSRLQPLGSERIFPGALVMAPFTVPGGDPEYFRATVSSVTPNGVVVYFIDYGNTDLAFTHDLRFVPVELLRIPPLALECFLAGVGPSQVRNQKGLWSDEANQWFKRVTADQIFIGEIFSVVGDVVSLDLRPATQPEISVTKHLVDKGWADVVEESYPSRKNHEIRLSATVLDPQSLRSLDRRFTDTGEQRRSAAEEDALGQLRLSDDMYGASVQLKGPNNPLEMKLYGRCKSLELHEVRVESGSVNSVLLDQNFHEGHERLLIAAQVGISSNGSLVTARNTTLLPAIHGLPAILSLMFAPAVEMRLHPSRTHMSGALCGLGYDTIRREPVFAEHDMEVAFDAEITPMDLLLINKIRREVNRVIGSNSTIPLERALLDVQRNVVAHVLELVGKRRAKLQLFEGKKRHEWNLLPEQYVLPVSSLKGSVLLMISGVELLPPANQN